MSHHLRHSRLFRWMLSFCSNMSEHCLLLQLNTPTESLFLFLIIDKGIGACGSVVLYIFWGSAGQGMDSVSLEGRGR